jgi:hypothetical protein
MMEDARLDSLKAKHAALESQINDEERRPFPDQALVHDLKKQKLKIKDELQRFAVH